MRASPGRIGFTALTLGTFALALLPGLAWPQAKPAEGQAQTTAAPTGETKELLQKIQGYQSWPKFPEYANGPKKSQGHGGTFVVAHYNDTAAQAVQSGAASYPDGSIIVKENRPQADAKPVALTTMAKMNGAWYWVKSTPAGQVFTAKGKPVAGQQVAACAGCHASAPKDGVFSK